jgi:hypothetical protein
MKGASMPTAADQPIIVTNGNGVYPKPWYAQILILLLGNQGVTVMLPTLLVVGFVCLMYYKQADDVKEVTNAVNSLRATVSEQTAVLQGMKSDLGELKTTSHDSLKELERIRRLPTHTALLPGDE